MRKLLNKPWFVAVLAVGAVVLCIWSLRDQLGGTRRRAPRPADVTVPRPAIAATEEAEGTSAADDAVRPPIDAVLEAIVYPEKIPDPFARGETTIVAGQEEPESGPPPPDERETVRLSGVWTQGAARLAVLNNRIVQSGDRIGRLTVDEIQVDGIWVSHWRGRDYVPFGDEFTLVTPGSATASPIVARHEN
jgi:hypothetical protein